MGMACSTHGRDEKFIQKFWWKTGKGETTTEIKA
jgi:hypothetical protein